MGKLRPKAQMKTAHLDQVRTRTSILSILVTAKQGRVIWTVVFVRGLGGSGHEKYINIISPLVVLRCSGNIILIQASCYIVCKLRLRQ